MQEDLLDAVEKLRCSMKKLQEEIGEGEMDSWDEEMGGVGWLDNNLGAVIYDYRERLHGGVPVCVGLGYPDRDADIVFGEVADCWDNTNRVSREVQKKIWYDEQVREEWRGKQRIETVNQFVDWILSQDDEFIAAATEAIGADDSLDEVVVGAIENLRL